MLGAPTARDDDCFSAKAPVMSKSAIDQSRQFVASNWSPIIKVGGEILVFVNGLTEVLERAHIIPLDLPFVASTGRYRLLLIGVGIVLFLSVRSARLRAYITRSILGPPP